ncbi:magnesium chelatase subunit H [Congregibacter brevis]|uniref:magnesium chelatase n=1 Tax=Congregibacter brevis TaxID=3081201 RepID=A0ABZ0ICZ5_9GAMM|nr:magnesium chelatase subunit H [Congregibacter sp. IMCC45268]
MKQKPTSAGKKTAPKAAKTAADDTLSFVVITLDNHVTSSISRAALDLQKDAPGLSVKVHASADWHGENEALKRCKDDIATGDIILVTMMFMEDQINAVLPALQERRDHCDAMICAMSGAEIMKLTRMGKFTMDGEATGAVALLKRLRGNSEKAKKPPGAQQLAVLKQLPRILRFIPGTSQDVRAYFLTLQYWLAGSEENLRRMIAYLTDRYASKERSGLRGKLKSGNPVDYPDVGLYDPLATKPIFDKLGRQTLRKGQKGTVGLLIMRSYALAENTEHYDAVIEGLRARGLSVITAFASGLDARPAVDAYFMKDGEPTIDLLVSLTGFSLVGGPAYNDSKAAENMLASLDVPYIAAHALEFQSIEQWETSGHGLMPVEATMMVAIPELDGASVPSVYGGRSDSASMPGTKGDTHAMRAHPERVDALADRALRLVELRKTPKSERRVAMVIFNFPPNAGNTGTAANLSVFQSLMNTLRALREDGYEVEVPQSVDALREAIVEGNAARYGAMANVHTLISSDDHVTREPHLEEIEAQWGPVPGKQNTDGRSLFVLGAQFGNVFVGVQPGFGYEGDPMRLLFERGFSPTHAFSAFYRYIREDFAAHSLLHFGTHGALEFMPGKQSGMSESCWPQRLIGDIPHYYLYAANNPSEGMIAKRRAGATLISYLTPPITRADLYKGLQELKETIERWRSGADDSAEVRSDLAAVIQAQGAELDLCAETPAWNEDSSAIIETLRRSLIELEETLIPYGLHVVGETGSEEERKDMLTAVGSAGHELILDTAQVNALERGDTDTFAELLETANPDRDDLGAAISSLTHTAEHLHRNPEIEAILHALDGRFIAPAPGGDLLRTTDILPTGRNLHGFDPYRLPSQFAMRDGLRQTANLLSKHAESGEALPETVALVLWGSDNMKNEGGPIAQALALMGAEPRIDGYGRVSGARLISLEELGRPRIDVIMTLSGIFRDLLPLQTRMLAEASYLASAADEPLEMNYVRKHTLAQQEEQACDFETAALRVFSNADGAYGSNVNLLVDDSRWEDDGELADAYTSRKCFAYGRDGNVAPHAELLNSMLATVDLAYQNLDSVEVGITSLDQYFDTLGGISRAVKRARNGQEVPVYISDQTSNSGKVRTLEEQVALETRTRVLNPKWYEGILEHGFEGVRQIEAHVTNTLGWSATTGQVAPWVYQSMSETFILDESMRDRLAQLNPHSAIKVVNRLLEASDRDYWQPDQASLDALHRASEDLEDWLEGIPSGVVAA